MGRPLKTSFVTMWELMKPSWCPNPNAGLVCDLTAEVEQEGNIDESIHDLAVIHHFLALKTTKQDDRQPTEPSEGNSPSDWVNEGTCLASSCGMEGHVCGNGHCLKTLSEQHRQLAKLYGRLTTTLGFCSMVSSIQSLERLERAHDLVTSLSVEVFPGALQTEQKIGSWREAFENEMNLKHSEGYYKTVGSKNLVGSSAASYCNSKYPTHLVVVDARLEHRLIDQLFSVPKCVRLSRKFLKIPMSY